MTPGVEPYFEQELAFLAEYRDAFQRRYPAEAGRLLPDKNRVPDPHLDRFIEGFAALAARIHHKLDTDFPELTEALVQVLYPHLLRPIPSQSIAQFECDPAHAPGTAGTTFPRHTALRTQLLGAPATACRFRTGYPVTLWPIEVVDAQVLRGPFPGAPPRTSSALRLVIGCRGGHRFADLDLKSLRLFLSADKQVLVTLYEALFLHCSRIVFRSLEDKKPPLTFAPAECMRPVGFDLDEAVLPMPRESFAGYGLLLEFLSFQPKFHFIDLGGWEAVRQADLGKQVEILFYLNRTHENLEQGVHADTFLLGCTPIINLFPQSAQPMAVTQTRHEYRVVPFRHAPEGVEVFSIDEVNGVDEGRVAFPLQPFYAYHLGQTRETFKAFWHATRRPSLQEGDRGTDVWMFVLDGAWGPKQPASLVLDIHATCNNRDYPARFIRGGETLRLVDTAQEPLGPITCLLAPTPTLRPPRRRAAHWRVLSQLGLNHKSLTDPVEGLRLLQETLRLCDFSDATYGSLMAQVNRQVVEGIVSLQARRALGRASSGGALGLCRGVAVTLELNEKSFTGIGLYLFASVIERFLGLSASVNSFSQLSVRTMQGDVIKKWPPRAAELQLH